ncbi:hypothetical protein PPL_02541 [Heterostelium album PN500]|uniref:Ankyrin repeat-containing protein n=1 Tax=Heterostelium pallidum (strain ATCC 26659 / Pp 5 / PN500) TaxID=670386 RepID=D3B2D1_HETP5|nr:hypothetical protein PPL_02541 [Heterostelium album PN500]EFA84506.1 hypothetical protein PPL_02541 [Heterostelium album PN500]|eukprot:XP_020436619.1 hypothetical protein PPL_02541 [Heterostelium album PN500]
MSLKNIINNFKIKKTDIGNIENNNRSRNSSSCSNSSSKKKNRVVNEEIMSNQRDINSINNSFKRLFMKSSSDGNPLQQQSSPRSKNGASLESSAIDEFHRRTMLLKSILKNQFVFSIIFGFVRCSNWLAAESISIEPTTTTTNGNSSTLINSTSNGLTLAINSQTGGKRYNEIYNVEWITSNRHFSLLKYKLDRKESLYGWSTTCFVSLLKYCTDWELVVQLLKSSKHTELHRQLPIFDHSSYNPSLELITYLYKHGYKGTSDAVDNASAAGHLPVVEFLTKHKYPATKAALNAAASAGHLNVVVFLSKSRSEGASKLALDEAAINGHLEVVRFLLANRTEGATPAAIDRASLEGHTDIVVSLVDSNIIRGTKDAVDFAAVKGHLRIVEYLTRAKYECSIAALNSAATNGHLELVKFLHYNRTEGCSVMALNGAATNGHLHIVRFLHENRTEGCSTSAMNGAITNGHLSVVEFLHYNRTEGCSKNIIEEASKFSNNLAVIQFLLVQRKESFTGVALSNAAEKGNLDILKLLTSQFDRTTVATGQLPIVRFNMATIAARGYLETLKFLAEQQLGVDCYTVECMNQACQFGRLEVVKYLHENRSEGCTAKALNSAILNGHLGVVRFLMEKRSEQFGLADREQAIQTAAKLGKLEIVKLFVEEFNCEPLLAKNVQCCFDESSQRGHLAVIKYLYSKYPEQISIEKSLSYAISIDQFDIVDYLDRIKKQKRAKVSSSAGAIPFYNRDQSNSSNNNNNVKDNNSSNQTTLSTTTTSTNDYIHSSSLSHSMPPAYFTNNNKK